MFSKLVHQPQLHLSCSLLWVQSSRQTMHTIESNGLMKTLTLFWLPRIPQALADTVLLQLKSPLCWPPVTHFYKTQLLNITEHINNPVYVERTCICAC